VFVANTFSNNWVIFIVEVNPDVPDEPLEPEIPEVPLEPEVPDEPFVPLVPELPEVPFIPEEPEVPLEPLVPEEPEIPLVPEEPEIPLVPEEPDVPLEPDVLPTATPTCFAVTIQEGASGELSTILAGRVTISTCSESEANTISSLSLDANVIIKGTVTT